MMLSVSKRGGNRPGRPAKNVELNKAFARRLQTAIDNNPNVPPKYHGQSKWFVDRIKDKFGVTITVQTISSYLSGQFMPSPTSLHMLATVLGVDDAWLGQGDPEASYGHAPQTPRNAEAAAAVNLLAGMIALDGGTIAFPDESNPDQVHLFAIICGAQYALRVAVGELDGDTIRFHRLPPARANVVVLGVVRRKGFDFGLFEITPAVYEAYRQAGRNGPNLVMPAADIEWIDSFKERL